MCWRKRGLSRVSDHAPRGQRQPIIVSGLATLAGATIAFPILALMIRANLPQLWTLVREPANSTAFLLSVLTAACAALGATVAGTCLALWLGRREGPFVVFVRALVLVPLVLPPVVSGIALLYAYGRSGPLGGLLDALGMRIVFTSAAVVLAQVFVSLPFVVVTVEGAVRSRGLREEAAAAMLGAGPWRVFTAITLPRFAPMIGVAALLAFARSLGEFGATLTFAGSLEGVTRTLPLQIYLLRESDMSAAVGMSLILVVFSLAVVSLAYARGPRRGGERLHEEVGT